MLSKAHTSGQRITLLVAGLQLVTASCARFEDPGDHEPGMDEGSSTGLAKDDSCDARDNDRDGKTDEHFETLTTTCGVGACASLGTITCVDGRLATDCTEGEAAATDETCDGRDDDCDERIDEEFQASDTSCGVGACAALGETSCVRGKLIDSCTPMDAADSDHSCDDVDDDCDARIDEDFASYEASCGVGVCTAAGTVTCVDGELAQDCSPSSASSTTDAVCDGRDEDCDGDVDEDFATADTTCGVGACASAGRLTCVEGRPTDDCRAKEPTSNDETCDGNDDDCDGRIDEEFPVQRAECGTGNCASSGERLCRDGSVYDSCLPRTPALDDDTCDGLDDDCDDRSDEDFVAFETSCGVGTCAALGAIHCVDGELIDDCRPATEHTSDETCDDFDDDCNGRVDEDFESEPTQCGRGECASTGERVCFRGDVHDTCVQRTAQPDDALCDRRDDDCDGVNDEDFVPVAISCGGAGSCALAGALECIDGQLVEQCPPSPAASADETCDGIDDDCDGLADEDFEGELTQCGVGGCAATGAVFCVRAEPLDTCIARVAAPEDSACDGVDADCDGRVDEDFRGVRTRCGTGECATAGETQCVDAEVIDSCVPGEGMLADAACDGRDDDCDGRSDEGFVGATTHCGLGPCAAMGSTRCRGGELIDDCRAGAPTTTAETTCDGVDDDCDGLIDFRIEDSRPVSACQLDCAPREVPLDVREAYMPAEQELRDRFCDTPSFGCERDDGTTLMTYCMQCPPQGGGRPWAVCQYSSGFDFTDFDIADGARGALAAVFVVEGPPVTAGLRLWYGNDPNRRSLALKAANVSLLAGRYVRYFAPQDVCNPGFATSACPVAACGAAVGACALPGLDSGALTLAAEDCEDPPAAVAQGSIHLESVTYYPSGCLCTDNAACAGGSTPSLCNHELGQDLPHAACSSPARCAGLCMPADASCDDVEWLNIPCTVEIGDQRCDGVLQCVGGQPACDATACIADSTSGE